MVPRIYSFMKLRREKENLLSFHRKNTTARRIMNKIIESGIMDYAPTLKDIVFSQLNRTNNHVWFGIQYRQTRYK